jgi:phosphoglycolate phosphatase-like HAD superfamily hydrolase
MTRKGRRPDLEAVLGGLKDFQRDSVEYVFRRLYLDDDATNRFLVADEVGLGKTLVARGLIARAVDHLWNKVDRIDVVYICSNSDIARQNINRLNVTGQGDFALASRITLLPVQLRQLKRRRLNFVSFTPGTSFDLRSSLGLVEERVLLYHLLKRTWRIDGAGPQNLLQGNASKENFRWQVRVFKSSRKIDKELADAFCTALEGKTDLRARFDELCARFARSRKHIPPADIRDRNRLIGDLRALLAATCLEALEPDLIIMDEFQRFKHLLSGEDPASILARSLFEYSDHQSKARVLLLSATPYKMYTLAHESDEDHYRDFIDTLRFLLNDEQQSARVKALLGQYRRQLYRLTEGEAGAALQTKGDLEGRLRRVMSRVERLGITTDRDCMLAEAGGSDMRLGVRDLQAYSSLQRVARILGQGDILEYWKSSPYLLNFMDDYRLKQEFSKAVANPERSSELAAVLSEGHGLLPWHEIAAYADVDPENARLRLLMEDTIGRGAWRLLWIPPSLPYYRLAGPYDDPNLRSFTKRLVFSSWKVVPRSLSMLVSYEAERRMICMHEDEPENSPEARRHRRPLLRFTQTDGRLAGMPVLGLLYPCATLSRHCDPLTLARSRGEGGPLPTTAGEAISWAQDKIERRLRRLNIRWDEAGAADETWYWAAPILLDLQRDKEQTLEWFRQSGLASTWSGAGEERDEDEGESRWAQHVEQARAVAEGKLQLGRPPADLPAVLARLALAGPGIASLRALTRVVAARNRPAWLSLQNSAAQVAWSTRALFNLPEVMALLRSGEQDEPYWRKVLDYCVNGGLQATLDEYAHMLRESLGLLDKPPEETAARISAAMRTAISIRTSTPTVDEIVVESPENEIRSEKHRMHNRFAIRFGEEKSEDGAEVTHAGQVREAFNSPFWPFVLVTTSVGQEGLDFHPYCHAVVHWNLPANPVDLEQREGRVHRYKGHAVRKNVALHYGGRILADGQNTKTSRDPWQALFDVALRDRAVGTSDIVPYWVYPLAGGEMIERHVPAMPLSRDVERFADLRRSLALYRMVFGQPRQEDLVAHLLSHLPSTDASNLLQNLRIDLSPPCAE